METFTTLFLFTVCYGLLFLSYFPAKPVNEYNNFSYEQNKPAYKKYDLTWPYFFSFLGGYVMASFMVYLIQDYI